MAKKKPIYRPDDFDEVDDRPSRSQLKRDSCELQKLGLEFAALGDHIVKEAGIPDEVVAALLRIKTISKHEAKRRHLQYVGKLMRSFDVSHVREIVEAAREGRDIRDAAFHHLENVRDKLLSGDDDLLQGLYDTHPEHGQRLRQLVLSARREKAKGKPPKDSRALFKLLRQLPNPEEEK